MYVDWHVQLSRDFAQAVYKTELTRTIMLALYGNARLAATAAAKTVGRRAAAVGGRVSRRAVVCHACVDRKFGK